MLSCSENFSEAISFRFILFQMTLQDTGINSSTTNYNHFQSNFTCAGMQSTYRPVPQTFIMKIFSLKVTLVLGGQGTNLCRD